MFIGVSERQETETNIRQLKEKKKNDKDLENYRNWIQKSRKYLEVLGTTLFDEEHKNTENSVSCANCSVRILFPA